MEETLLLRGIQKRTATVREDADRIVIEARAEAPALCCPHCQQEGMHRHGHQIRRVQDLPVDGKALFWEIVVPRYKCPACGKTAMPEGVDWDRQRRVTRRLQGAVATQEKLTGLRETARLFRLSPSAVHRICREPAQPRAVLPVFSLEEEGEGDRRRYAVYSAPSHILMAVVPRKNPRALAQYLENIPSPQEVRAVVIGPDPALRSAVKAALPHVAVALDKRIMLDLIEACMSQVLEYYRQRIPHGERLQFQQIEEQIGNRQGLSLPPFELARLWYRIQRYPRLKSAYYLQESAKRFFTQPSQDPLESWKYFLWSVPVDLPGYSQIYNMGFAWHVEILNYLTHYPKSDFLLPRLADYSDQSAPVSAFCDDATFRRLLDLNPMEKPRG